jgi:outer membrane protein
MRKWVLILLVVLPVATEGATKLDFETVLQAVLRHSYDLRMSAVDVRISHAQLKEARSAYFPTISARFNSQYTKDLTNTTVPQVTAVGETILVQNTFFQDSLSLSASLNLYDFGARENKVLVAATDIPLKEAIYRQSVRDTKITVLQTYRDLLTISSELASKSQLLMLYKDLALTTERLFDAGLASKVDVSDQAIKVVKIVDEIDNLKLKMSASLQDLTLLTGERYETDTLELNPLPGEARERDEADGFDLTASPEHRIYRFALKKKQAELNVLKKELLYPQFSLYSNYILYGQDPNSYKASYGDLKERNFYVGLVATIPLFDGLKNSAQVERVRLEIDRLRIEKEKRLSELSSRYEKLQEETRVLEKAFGNQQAIMMRNEENAAMTARLTDRKVVDHAEYLRRQIELVIQKHEMTRARTLNAAAAIELAMLSEVRN